MSDQPNQPENDDHEFTDDDAPDAPPKKKTKLPKSKQRALRVATPTEMPAEEAAWRNSLRYNEDGTLTKDPGNAALLMINDERWRGAVRYDEFADRVRWFRDAPAMQGMPNPKVGKHLDRQAVTYVQHWLRRVVGPAFSREACEEALYMAAQANKFHPVRDYLSSLAWDGTPRVATWLPTYLGTTEDRYHAEVGRMWLVSAVARAFLPGVQADYMLVLEGAQGLAKTSALRALAGEWLLEGMPDIRDQTRAASSIQGKWIVEVSELEAIRGAAVQLVKAWLTRVVDTYRGAYQKFERDAPRQCIFAGTTNEERYLNDPTGARRFWPVKCGAIDVKGLHGARDQLWAEAKEIFMGGAADRWHPAKRGHWAWWPAREDVELTEALRDAQDARHEVDEWEQRIDPWVSVHGRLGVTIGEILSTALGIEPAKWDVTSQRRVGAILRRLGWTARQQRDPSGARARRYYPSPT